MFWVRAIRERAQQIKYAGNKFVIMALTEKAVDHENIFVNLERKMKCGVGKCGHCQINHTYVCMDGPVFRYSELGNTPEAI